MIMKYALGSNLILSTGYGSTTPKTHVSKVLDTASLLMLHRAKEVTVLCEIYKN